MGENPFTQYAGQTTIIGAKKDAQGNAEGTQYDLAKDGAFDGMKVVVLSNGWLDQSPAWNALKSKGFEVSLYNISTNLPDVATLSSDLQDASQLWFLDLGQRILGEGHINAIKNFFDAGHGVYIWGDNDPLYVDTNRIANALIECQMSGNWPAGQIINESVSGSIGFLKHQITTGLEFLYEGVTVAQILDKNEILIPILRGSDGYIISAAYDRNGKRAILDGGFTRLYQQFWDDAGTARFVKNAAAWLVNWERFNKAPKRATSLAEQGTKIRTQLNRRTTEQPLNRQNQKPKNDRVNEKPKQILASQTKPQNQTQQKPKQTLGEQTKPQNKTQQKPKQTLRSQGSQWNKD